MSRKPRPPVSSSSRSSAPGRGRGRRPIQSGRQAPDGRTPDDRTEAERKGGERPGSRQRSESPRRAAAPARPPRGKAPGSARASAKPQAEPRFDAHEPQRIAKLLARAGVGSRRDIERMIEDGRIALNEEILTTPATIVTSLKGVTVDGNPVSEVEPTRLWRFFKPAGCLTTVRDPEGRPTIYDLLPQGAPRVVTIGRLDFNTEGLLLLTNNGELKRWMELPANAVERIYRARVRGRVNYNALADLIEGITIDGVRYGSINAEVESSQGMTHWIAVKISEGKNREVRNVLGHLGLQVSRLIRTNYGPFSLDGLREGDMQEISPGTIPGAPGDLLPPPGFEIEDPYPRRREEVFAPRRTRRDTEEQAPAPAPPQSGRTYPGKAGDTKARDIKARDPKGRDRRDDGPRRRAPRDAAPEFEAAPEPVRPLRRQSRASQARGGLPAPRPAEARAETSRKPASRKPVKGTLTASTRPAAGDTPETGRPKLERKAGWARPKPKTGPKPRAGSKPKGRRK